MDLGLVGRPAFVTGATRGIGRAIAFALADQRCRVGICARTSEHLDQVVSELRSRTRQVHAVPADVTHREQVERAVAECAEVLGGLQLVVANVGGSVGGKRLEETTDEDWATTFDMNVVAAVRTIRAAVPYLREAGGGSVVVVSSISGRKPGPRAQYGAAKAAENLMVSSLARELAPDRIRVNAVSPGSILFPGGGWDWRRQNDPEGFERFLAQELPYGRLGTPQEVADVVAFMLSERARWVNGADIPVDGAQGRPFAV